MILLSCLPDRSIQWYFYYVLPQISLLHCEKDFISIDYYGRKQVRPFSPVFSHSHLLRASRYYAVHR